MTAPETGRQNRPMTLMDYRFRARRREIRSSPGTISDVFHFEKRRFYTTLGTGATSSAVL